MSSEHTRPGDRESQLEPKRPDERLEDLEVGDDAATDVKGGEEFSLNYTQIQVTYTKQNPSS